LHRSQSCWSRVRYGTNAGCDIHRFNADHIEAAITGALLDFYTHRSDLIEQAVAEFQHQHTADSTRLRTPHRSRRRRAGPRRTSPLRQRRYGSRTYNYGGADWGLSR
jgi:hypothetical protein